MNPIKLSLRSNTILYLQGVINYTVFHYNHGGNAVSSSTLKKYEMEPRFQSFIRISKGLMVNPQYIVKIMKDGHHFLLQLSNGKILQTSRRKGQVFRDTKFIIEEHQVYI